VYAAQGGHREDMPIIVGMRIMSPREKAFYDRKLEHIKRDYEHVLSAMLKFSDHANGVRQWNITVIIAYLALAKACVDKGIDVSILPLVGAIYLFWVMEAFVRAQMHLYREQRLAIADRLFSEKDDARFRQLVEEYSFPRNDERIPGKNWWGKGGRLHRFFRGLVNCQTLVFYILPLTILTVWYSPWRSQFTFRVPIFAALLLPAVLFVIGALTYWRKYPRQ
jgi:hypothetical protein